MRHDWLPHPAHGSRRPRFVGGFTLIELLVVIAVVAVLASLAAPSMGNLIVSQKLRSAASSLQLALVQARSEAIKRNVSVTLSPASGGWGAGWSVVDPANPSGPALQVGTLPSGVAITTAATQVVYQSNGRTTLGSGASFVLTGGTAGASRCVAVDPSGRSFAKEGASC